MRKISHKESGYEGQLSIMAKMPCNFSIKNIPPKMAALHILYGSIGILSLWDNSGQWEKI